MTDHQMLETVRGFLAAVRAERSEILGDLGRNPTVGERVEMNRELDLVDAEISRHLRRVRFLRDSA